MGVSAPIAVIQHGTGNPGQSIQAGEVRGIQIGDEEVELSLFADDNPDDFAITLSETTNKYSKVAEYETNI